MQALGEGIHHCFDLGDVGSDGEVFLAGFDVLFLERGEGFGGHLVHPPRRVIKLNHAPQGLKQAQGVRGCRCLLAPPSTPLCSASEAG